MSDKNKNKKSSLSDFIRYSRNEMSGKERNSFEKELQKDPFSDEAEEGLSKISTDSVEEDILTLQKRLVKKTKLNTRNNFYRIAAAVAVLMIVSGIFFIIQRKDTTETLSENITQEKKIPFTINKPGVISEQPIKSFEKKQVITTPEKSKKAEHPVINKVSDLYIEESQKTITKDSEVTKPDTIIITADEAVAESFATEKKIDMARAAGAPASAKSEISREYIPPQPSVGKDSFDIYIAKSVRNPGPDNHIPKAVLMKFKVKPDSTLTGIIIVSSPGKAWSKEAIRLIKTGPVWKPAIENGKSIEKEVRLEIVFR
jgi:hypothetical protein